MSDLTEFSFSGCFYVKHRRGGIWKSVNPPPIKSMDKPLVIKCPEELSFGSNGVKVIGGL